MAYKINPALGQQIAFNASTSVATTNKVDSSGIVLYATKDCFITMAAAPAATATGAANVFVPAQTFLELDLGANRNIWKIAAIGASESGTLYVNEVTK